MGKLLWAILDVSVMEDGRRKNLKRHLPEERIDELLREAENNRRQERLGFLKTLMGRGLLVSPQQ